MHDFKANESLSAVCLFIQQQTGLALDLFSLTTTFPRKIFVEEDMNKSLSELGMSVTFLCGNQLVIYCDKGFYMLTSFSIIVFVIDVEHKFVSAWT